MKRAEQQTEGMQKIADLIDQIGVGMLTWDDGTGRLSSRPMLPLEMDADGSLWYFTRLTPDKEAAQGRVNIAFARPDSASYVSVSGRATLLQDHEKIVSLWSALAEPWFPEGPEDPSLTLLRVDVDDAEFWDASTKCMVRTPYRAPISAQLDAENGKVLNPQFPAAVV